MIHFAQNNDIIIGVDFGYGNDIAVKTTAKVHEAVRKEQYEVAGVINDTLKHNSRTLQELREECDVIQRKRQSPR